jgi:hypothetical protein
MNIRICNFVCREKKSRIRRKQNQSKKKIQKMIDDEFTLLIIETLDWDKSDPVFDHTAH